MTSQNFSDQTPSSLAEGTVNHLTLSRAITVVSIISRPRSIGIYEKVRERLVVHYVISISCPISDELEDPVTDLNFTNFIY